MTDLALGLPAVHTDRLRELSAAAEAAHTESVVADVAYTTALAELELFAPGGAQRTRRGDRRVELRPRTVGAPP